MRNRFRFVLLLLAFCAPSLGAADGDKLYFSRDFPGSVPEYFSVEVSTDGKVIYRESIDDEVPIEFEAPAADVSRLFEISEQLGYFEQPLSEPKRKSAFTGDKVLRYTKVDGGRSQVAFAITDNESAQELVNWFLRVADTEWHVINIERAIQFDRLGVNKAILQFHTAFDKGRVVAPRQFLPLLKSISNDMKIVHLARSRAAGLAERIEAGEVGGE